MRFDLFYELSVPAHSGRNEPQVFHDTLAELVLADELGFSTAWLVEHHFMPEYSHSSAPDLFLAALSQKTVSLRLGLGIVPLPYHHPVQVAERIATLDVLSNGRVDFGFGRGFSPKEYENFNVSMEQSRRVTLAAFQIIRQLLQGATVSVDNEFFHLNEVSLLPQAVQRGGPPLWMAAVSPESFTQAAELGVGVLAGPFKPWFMVKEDIKRYQHACQSQSPRNLTQHPVYTDVGMTIGLLCLEDGKRARALARESFGWFYRELLVQTTPVLERLHVSYEFYRKLGRFRALLRNAHRLSVLEALGMVIVGDAEHCIKKLRQLQNNGVDRVLCAIGAGVLPSPVVQESMYCLAESVFPHFNAQS
jgi:alkanesulfonate monooxygenase SsuD/methylene tetrahydromethanopterin reductase-like flavin-dependent oxidoreductase (luciferase family)